MQQKQKENLKHVSKKELTDFLSQNGEKSFRSKQIRDAVFKHNASSFDDLNNIPKDLRNRLAEHFDIASLELIDRQESADGSVKYAFRTCDRQIVEAVFMPADEASEPRRTVCISTMTGCPLACSFCATGSLTKARKLSVAEILEQVYLVEKYSGESLTNVVYMGMGEPMLNFDACAESLRILVGSEYKRFSKRKITVSTVGIPGKIKEFADTDYPVKLAISLHATTNGLRDKLIPANKKLNISELLEETRYYYRKTSLPVTFEYIVFTGLNDSDDDVKRLTKIARGCPSKINLIPYNNIDIPTNVKSNQVFFTNVEKLSLFAKKIRQNSVQCNIRRSYGDDISGACGQLAANI